MTDNLAKSDRPEQTLDTNVIAWDKCKCEAVETFCITHHWTPKNDKWKFQNCTLKNKGTKVQNSFLKTLFFLHKLYVFSSFLYQPICCFLLSLTSVNCITYFGNKVAAISNLFSQTIAQFHPFAADLIWESPRWGKSSLFTNEHLPSQSNPLPSPSRALFWRSYFIIQIHTAEHMTVTPHK